MEDYSLVRQDDRAEGAGRNGAVSRRAEELNSPGCESINAADDPEKGCKLSVIMPCLNEEATVGSCVAEARSFFGKMGIRGEVVVVDNGSTDDSAAKAAAHGARVIMEERRGYGRAIRTGLKNSSGDVMIIGDCDQTYDFYNMDMIYGPLCKGRCDIVIGDRLENIERGAMSLTHRMGVKFLSFLGRLRYHVDVRDFHCGLRGMTREAFQKMELHTDGMEFATEMIAEAARRKLKIGQTRVVLRKSPAGRKSKLRAVRDGLRHMAYMCGGG